MPSIPIEHYPAYLARQCLTPTSSDISVRGQCIAPHIAQICNSTDEPHWKVRGQELQQHALETLHPISAWSARARIAPLKKTLSDSLLAVSGISLDSLSRPFFSGALSTVFTHIGGLARQLTPWDITGAQAQHVSGTPASPRVSYVDIQQPYMTRPFKRSLLKILVRHHYLDSDQIDTLSDRKFVAAVICFLRDSPGRAAPMLARNIQKMRGAYGAHRDEQISVAGQDAIILRWLESAVLNANVNDVLLQGLQANSNATVADLPQVIKPHADLHQPTLNLWVWHHVLQRVLPILQTTTYDGDTDLRWEDCLKLRLDHFEWGKIHAGLMFANAVNPDKHDLSMAEAMDLGTMLLLQLQEGAAPPEWWRFFELPAKLRYVLTRHTQEYIETNAISCYVDDYARLQQKNCPFLQFKNLMESYQTRLQMAHNVIDATCPELPVEHYLNWRDDYLCFPCGPDETPTELENITEQYQRQIDNIGAAYEKIAPLLLIAAWGELKQEEIDFLINAKITASKARFAANDILPLAGLFFYLAHQKRLTIPLRHNVELFSATSIGAVPQERIYALERCQDGYQVSRIDRAPQAYLALTDPERKKQYRENRFTLHIDILDEETLKPAGEDLSQFIRDLAKAHRIDFARQLHEVGYEKTSKEKIADFALSMLPFYNCIEASNQGRMDQAIIACSIDVIALMPVLGGISRLSIKFGQALAQGSVLAARQVISDLTVRGALRAALGQSGKHFLRYAVWPATQTIGKKEISLMTLATLRSLDPGVGLMYLLGRGSVGQALRLGNYMRHALPDLKKILPRLEIALQHLPSPSAIDSIIYARMPGLTEAQPVIRLNGARYLNKHDVYIRINPDSGEVFGKKYYFSADDTLTPVPTPTARHLHNIRHQGLGGNGARAQSKLWNQLTTQPIPLSYIVLYRLQHLRPIDIEISGGVQGIARAMNTQADQLQLYFNRDGSFTDLSKMKLEYGVAGTTSKMSSPLLYRNPSAQDIADWKRLRSSPDNTVTKYLFAAVRNIHPVTWHKLSRGSRKNNHMSLQITDQDIHDWMKKKPEERIGNSGRFALSRGLSPSTFSRYISGAGELTSLGKRRFGHLLDKVTGIPDARQAAASNSIAGAAMPATNNYAQDGVSSALLRQLQSLTTATERLNLARQHHVNPDQLTLYITETGQLTPKGKKRIAMDDFAALDAS